MGSCIPECNGSSFHLHTQNTYTHEVISKIHYTFTTRFGPRVKESGGDPRIPEHLHKSADSVSNITHLNKVEAKFWAYPIG